MRPYAFKLNYFKTLHCCYHIDLYAVIVRHWLHLKKVVVFSPGFVSCSTFLRCLSVHLFILPCLLQIVEFFLNSFLTILANLFDSWPCFKYWPLWSNLDQLSFPKHKECIIELMWLIVHLIHHITLTWQCYNC